MNEEEFQKIQTLLAHHERQIHDLSDIVTEQRQEIDRLKARLDKTSQKLADIELSSGGGEGQGLSVADQAMRDKPPHY